MNLQICVPFQECRFKCPMCVARGHKHNYEFDNLYKTNKGKYLRLLKKKLKTLDKDSCIVLTGECDPTQDMDFLEAVIKVVRKTRKDLPIELQTHNYNFDGSLDIDVLSYSITNHVGYQKCEHFYKLVHGTNRLVILLTKTFEFLNKYTFSAKGYNQVTFKTLQYGEDEATNEWIDKNKLNDISKIREIKLPDVSIKIDENCQTAEGRYEIFRSDGRVYKNWEERRKTI